MTKSEEARAGTWIDPEEFAYPREQEREMTKSEQARADAFADAETTWLNSTDSGEVEFPWLLLRAREAGELAVEALGAVADLEFEFGFAIRESILAARCARRAVPGLRGDK